MTPNLVTDQHHVIVGFPIHARRNRKNKLLAAFIFMIEKLTLLLLLLVA